MSFSDDDLRAAIARELPGVRADLERLVRIPGIAFEGFDHSHVERSAEAVAELLRGCGLDTQIVRGDGQPAVIGRRTAPPGAPTVLLYAHHDVQPAGDPALWTSDPFEPVERDGRLYGRGAADDKAGVMVHVAALRALGDELGVGVVVFVEGEEEIGSPTFGAFLAEHRDLLEADVIVVADSVNWKVGVPALTTSLRGLVDGVITVRTLDHAVHSGMYGGPVPDAMLATVRLLDSFWDAAGDLAIEGLVGGLVASTIVTALMLAGLGQPVWHALLLGPLVGLSAQAGDLAESMLKRAAGAKDSGTLIPGHGGILDRIDSFLFAAPVLAGYALLVAGRMV